MKSWTRSKEANAKHSDTYPDPKFGFAFRSYPYTGSFRPIDGKPDTPGMTGMEYSVSQEIPFPGRLSKEREVKRWEAEEYRFSFIKETNRFYADLFAILIQIKSAEQRLKLLDSAEKLTDSLKKTSGAIYSTGKKEFSSTGKSHIDKILNQEKKVDLEGKLNSLQAGLDYYLIPEKIERKELSIIPFEKILLEKETIYREKNEWNLEKFPKLQQANANLIKTIEEEKLGELTHYPDTEVFFSYMKRRRPFYMVDTGPIASLNGNWEVMDYNEFRGDLFSFGVIIRIPVWSTLKNKDLQMSNRQAKEAIEQEKKKIELAIKSDINIKIAQWKSIEKRIQFMEKEHLNVLNKNLSSMGAGYQTGKTSYAELANTQLEILELKLEIEEWKEKKQLLLISLMELTGDFLME